MEHQFIEKGEKQLYSVYHEPNMSIYKDVGVILCYPFGQEYIRCHKLYLNMATKIAMAGYHAMRFDYSGTGDSSGEFESIDLNTCLKDIELVISELKEACGITKVILIGVRFGATISYMYSKENKIDGLILWNPISDGAKYLKEIDLKYKEWLSGSFTKEKKNKKNSISSFGFIYSSALTSEIKKVKVVNTNFEDNIPVLLIDDEINYKKGSNISFERSINKEFWLKRENELDKSMVPMQELNKIVDWIKDFKS